MKKILLVEDDNEIVEVLQYILEKSYIVEVAKTKEEASKLIMNKYDIAVLDICLPDGESFDISKDIKCPIVYLTAKDDEETVLKGLSLGEEYITKPFKAKELLMRIEKILQRTGSNNLYHKDITIDMSSMGVYVENRQINITSLEYKIIEMLFENIGKTITRDKLADLIYKSTEKYVEDNTVSVYIKRIRDKLDRDYIKTLKRIGYIVEKD